MKPCRIEEHTQISITITCLHDHGVSQIDLMRKLEEFYRLKADSEDPDHLVKKAVTVVGLQNISDVRKVWVFNGKVHIGDDGQLIQPQESPYIWLADYVPEHILHQHGLPSDSEASSVSPHKMSRKALRGLIDALEKVFGRNFAAALLMLGAELLALHYEAIYAHGGKVPAAIAHGNVSLGKSMSTEAALSLLGVQGKNKVKSITDTQAMKSITDTQAMKSASKTTLGFIIDDPSKPSEIAEKLLDHFERATRASKDTPRTTFLTSVNMTCLENLGEMDARYVFLEMYQLRAVQCQQQLKKDDVEELLCEAVSGEETSKVIPCSLP